MNRLLIFLWLTLTLQVLAAGPVRIAISADPGLSNEVDLLTVELSKAPNVALLERQEIQKIANEHSLRTAETADGIKLGQLLGADGLLILSGAEAGGHKMLSVRLVAVRLGIVIHESISPPYEAAEGRAMASFLSNQMLPLVPKLRVAKKDAIPVSVAGIFSTVESPELRSLERKLTWLLVHRLTKETSLFVLERRRMQDLVWEKDLSPKQADPFMSGAVIIEGKVELRDGGLDLVLGLRRPGMESSQTSKLRGSANDLPALAERITASIMVGLKLKPAEQSWDLEKEAALYAEQAEWAMSHRMIDVCIASAESAWALGRRDVDLARLRVIAYSLVATPRWSTLDEDGNMRGGLNVGVRGQGEIGKDATRALAAAIRALEICSECLSLELPPSRTEGHLFRPVAAQALLYASELIRAHHVSGKAHLHMEQINLLRSLASEVSGQIMECENRTPVIVEMQYWRDRIALEAIATFSPYWYDSNEDVIAGFRRIFKSVRYGEDDDYALRTPWLLEDPILQTKAKRMVPWVVAWDPENTKNRQLDMIIRLKRLTESRDFDDQLVGWASLRWLVDKAATAKPGPHDIQWPKDFATALGAQGHESPQSMIRKGTLEFLWNEREKLAECHRTASILIVAGVLPEAERDYRLRYIRYLLEGGHHKHAMASEVLLKELKLNGEESLEFHRLCTVSREKAPSTKVSPYEADPLYFLKQVEKLVFTSRPDLKPKKATETRKGPKPVGKPSIKPEPAESAPMPPIIVDRYWYPSKHADAPALKAGFDFDSVRSGVGQLVRYADGKLWFVKSGYSSAPNTEYLACISLDSMEVRYHPLPFPKKWPWRDSPVITKDAVYVLNEKGSVKWDRETGKWSSLDVPKYPFHGRKVGDSVYLYYEFGSDFRGITLKGQSTSGSGILRLDGPDDRAVFLASSRRRPAETILDACDTYIPEAMFPGADGRISVALEFPSNGDRKIFQTTADGNWEKVMDLPNANIGQVAYRPVEGGVLALMYPRGSPHTFFQVILFDANHPNGKILLARSKPSDPPEAILPGAAQWDFAQNPEYLDGWDYRDGRLYHMKMLGNLYFDHKKSAKKPTPDSTLMVYTPGDRLPVRVPLRFKLSDADKAQIIANRTPVHTGDASFVSGPIAESLAVKQVERVEGMKVVPEGIIFYGGGEVGFWLLPAKEIQERIEQSRK